MNLAFFYTSLEGRISRLQFWLTAIPLFVLSFLVSLGVQSALGVKLTEGGFADPQAAEANAVAACWANVIVFLLISWPAAALMMKRRHDRGAPGVEVWIYLGLAIVVQLMQALGIDYAPVLLEETGEYMVLPGPFALISGAVFGIFALYMLAVLGFLKGENGTNEYGPNPVRNDRRV